MIYNKRDVPQNPASLIIRRSYEKRCLVKLSQWSRSIRPSLSLFVCLCLSVSVYLSRLSLSVCHCLSLTVYQPLSISHYASLFSLCVYVSLCVYICLSVSLPLPGCGFLLFF